MTNLPLVSGLYYSKQLMSGFTKLFSTIVHSTIWEEQLHVKVVWITMLALSDRNGRVFASVPGLATASRVTLPQCIEALERLSGPDEWSRTKTEEGRRIEAIDGGWRILNYLKYREKRDDDERRLQTREAVRRYREKGKPSKDVSQSKPRKPMKAYVEAEAEAEADTERSTPLARFARFWSVYPKKIGKGAAAKVFARLKPSDDLLGVMLDALEVVARSEQWKRDGGRYIPNPATWLNQRRWEDEPTVKRPDPVDWRDECKRLHNGTCENSRLHRHRLDMDAEKGQP